MKCGDGRMYHICRQVFNNAPLNFFFLNNQPWISEVKQNSLLAKGLLLAAYSMGKDTAYNTMKKNLNFAQRQS